MTYTPPVPRVVWRPGVHPGSATEAGLPPVYRSFKANEKSLWPEIPAPASGDPRLIAFTMDRGRADVTEQFTPGRVTLTLDNRDGELDPLVAGSEAEDGQAGTPIGIALPHPGNPWVWKWLWRGLVDSPWRSSRHQGEGAARTVEVDGVDWYGWSSHVNFPGSPHGIYNATHSGSAPDDLLWWRGPMSATSASPSTGATVWDYGRAGHHGDVTAGVVDAAPSMLLCSEPCLSLPSGAEITSRTPMTGHTDGPLRINCVIEVETNPPIPLPIVECRDDVSGRVRWEILLMSGGHPRISVYDAAGVPVSTVTLSAVNLVGRDAAHIDAYVNYPAKELTLQTPYANQTKSWSGTAAAPSGTIRVRRGGASGPTMRIAELAIVDRALTRAPWSTYSWTATAAVDVYYRGGAIDRWFDLDIPPMEIRPADLGFGFVKTATFAPQQAWWDALAGASGGAVYTLRDGRMRWRLGSDLGAWPSSRGPNDAYDDNVLGVVARLTDQPNPGPYIGAVSGNTYDWPILRYSGPPAVADIERLVTEVSADLARFLDVAAYRRYGRRPHSLDPVDRGLDPGYNSSTPSGPFRLFSSRPPIPTVPTDPRGEQAQALLTDRSNPTPKLPQVVLHPWGDQAITDFVIDDLELEARVLLTQSDPVTGAPVIDDLPVRVQAESWRWAAGGTDWTVTLTLAASTPNK